MRHSNIHLTNHQKVVKIKMIYTNLNYTYTRYHLTQYLISFTQNNSALNYSLTSKNLFAIFIEKKRLKWNDPTGTLNSYDIIRQCQWKRSKRYCNFKIVGYINNRDRLGHWWVAEMLLNAQSKFLVNKYLLSNRIYEFKVILVSYHMK